jgi:ribosomal protein L9
VIVEKLKKQTGMSVLVDDVMLEKPLSKLGLHVVPIRVGDSLVDLNVMIDKR